MKSPVGPRGIQTTNFVVVEMHKYLNLANINPHFELSVHMNGCHTSGYADIEF